ncbi:lysine N(6)-hydroxylase/L-ornithine N(5)-oxygenase family protein [Actinoplanes siamensis]|nr:SidA/IucD/PvdA family monooxygenase [Actinoplanes siamensis]
MPETTTPHHFVAGIGAGPANLSLAALAGRHLPERVVLFDRQSGPSWHSGMLGADARLQNSWIKDLVSLVDPCNRLSFLNYLVTTGRIFAFLNAQFTAVPRVEYARYLAWAAGELGTVHYGVDVVEVDFTDRFVVRGRNGAVATADHLVLGLGTRPRVPECFRSGTGLIEGAVLAEHLDAHLNRSEAPPAGQVIVVGGGQTGAEAVQCLIRRGYRDIRWLGRRHWFAPLDDSPPANDFYRPTYQKFFYQLPDEVRRSYLAEQAYTSDGISLDTLQEIYRANYEAFLRDGRAPVMLLPGRDVVRAGSTGGGLGLWCERGSGGRERHTAGLVVIATGREPAPMPLSAALHELVETDNAGEPLIEQDYSVRWKHSTAHKLFLQNRGRFTHGLADPNLSLLSVRSAMIVNSLADREAYTIRDEQVYTMWA